MTPLKVKANPDSPNDEYLLAEQRINEAFSDMVAENHIEYGSTMERKAPPPKWKKWLHKLLRLRY